MMMMIEPGTSERFSTTLPTALRVGQQDTCLSEKGVRQAELDGGSVGERMFHAHLHQRPDAGRPGDTRECDVIFLRDLSSA